VGGRGQAIPTVGVGAGSVRAPPPPPSLNSTRLGSVGPAAHATGGSERCGMGARQQRDRVGARRPDGKATAGES
jgi:hypothetical protein